MKKSIMLLCFAVVSQAFADGAGSVPRAQTTQDGYAYQFSTDGLDGSSMRAGDLITARAAKADACSQAFQAALGKPDLTGKGFSDGLFEQARCYSPCKTRKDFDFRHRCVDWKKSLAVFKDGTSTELVQQPDCVAKSDFQGFIEGKYEGSFEDEHGTCKKQFVSERVSLAPPVDFYVVLDNSGSMQGIYTSTIEIIVPELINTIAATYTDSKVLITTHNIGAGDHAFYFDGRDPQASTILGRFASEYPSSGGNSDEKPLEALYRYAAKSGTVRPDIKNIVIVISDEVSPDDVGAGSVDRFAQTFGKQAVLVTTLPSGAHPGVDAILAAIGARGVRTSGKYAVSEIQGLVDQHFTLEHDSGRTSIPLPKEYRSVVSLAVDGRTLEANEYTVLEDSVYFDDSVQLKSGRQVDAVLEYHPPSKDPLMVQTEALAWFTDKWQDKLDALGDQAARIELNDVTGIGVINHYIKNKASKTGQAAYLRLLMSLGTETFVRLMKDATYGGPAVDTLMEWLPKSKIPDQSQMRQLITAIRPLIALRTSSVDQGLKICGTSVAEIAMPAVPAADATPTQIAFLDRLSGIYQDLKSGRDLFCAMVGATRSK